MVDMFEIDRSDAAPGKLVVLRCEGEGIVGRDVGLLSVAASVEEVIKSDGEPER